MRYVVALALAFVILALPSDISVAAPKGTDPKALVVRDCRDAFNAPVVELSRYLDGTHKTKFLEAVREVYTKIPKKERPRIDELVLAIAFSTDWNAVALRPMESSSLVDFGADTPLAYGICVSTAMLEAIPAKLLAAVMGHEIYHLKWSGPLLGRILADESAADLYAARLLGPKRAIRILEFMLKAARHHHDWAARDEIRVRICLIQYEYKLRTQTCQ